MPPPPFPIPRVPSVLHRALPPVPPTKIPNGQFQFQPPLPRRPPSLLSFPAPILTSAPPLPKSNPPFNFLQKNPDYFSTYSCKEEIYVSSASVIELDCNPPPNNDGSDSGIYNASTNTGNNTHLEKYNRKLWNFSQLRETINPFFFLLLNLRTLYFANLNLQKCCTQNHTHLFRMFKLF